MQPLVIEDVPSSTTNARMNHQFENPFDTTIPIIQYAKICIEIPAETQEETLIKTQPTQPTREPPYPERLILQKTMEKTQFNLIGELNSL